MGLMNGFTGAVEYYHPTFLYESVWNLCGFLLLHFLSKRRKYDGQIALGYVAWYGLGRTFIEGLRMDSLYLGPVRISQLLAAVTCFAAVVVLMVMMFREHDPKNLFVNVKAARLAEQEAAEAEDTAEEKEEPSDE
jgi:phosphatidylglycerol:prolipoprotein diacylglycerol transferase